MGLKDMNSPTLKEQIFDIAAKGLIVLTAFILSQLWVKVELLEQQGKIRDKDLAQYMIQIESRLTAVETKIND